MLESELIEDPSIYPRNTVDPVWIGFLANKLRAGVTLPPILVDKKTKKIVDGFHRRQAYIRVYGEGCDIPAEIISFKNEDEMLNESARRNAKHGKPLSTVDFVHCANLGLSRGIPLEVIASSLGVEVNKLSELVEVRTARGLNNEPVVTKGGMVNPGIVDNDQKAAIKAASGNIQFHAGVLYRLIKNNVMDLAPQKVLDDLYLLRDLLNERLPPKS